MSADVRARLALTAWMAFAAGCGAYDPELVGSAPNGPKPSIDAGGAAGGAGRMQSDLDAAQRDGAAHDASTNDAGPDNRDAEVDAGADAEVDACTDRPDAAGCSCDTPDSDSDGVLDCLDECPDDALKVNAGACGCGESDADSDEDDTVDCMDGCANDPNQVAPGPCGCNPADGDEDGVGDCIDGCPADGNKGAPGLCGCGQPDSDQGGVTSCGGLASALVHRYRFDGSGTVAQDSVGTADGTITNASLSDTGTLQLAGSSSDEYVDLPNGLVSSLSSASFEIWLTWSGGAAWQRIFDFGSTTGAEGAQGTGETYLFLTPATTNSGGVFMRVAFSTNGSGNEDRINVTPLTSGTRVHLVLVVDETAHTMALYLDGASVGSVALSASLADIDDVNNWIGRSQFSDPELAATIDEVRIYDAALTAAQVQLSFTSGPDPAFLEP